VSDVEFTEYLGIRTLGMQDGAFVLELDLERRHMSRAERAHGGVLFALLDTALGRATGTFFLTDTIRQPDRERV
jgi:uncharacterized protein (TIGR00369 family)